MKFDGLCTPKLGKKINNSSPTLLFHTHKDISMFIVYGFAHPQRFTLKGVIFWPRNRMIRVMQGVDNVLIMTKRVSHGEIERIESLYGRKKIVLVNGSTSSLRKALDSLASPVKRGVP